MPGLAPIFASERSAARLLDMKPADFRRLVDCGALPAPVQIGEYERWNVDQLRNTLSGHAARPDEDFEL
ncbi:hypothetical protein AB9K41_19865 [Cribrihabitans sp. XS_ASV171]